MAACVPLGTPITDPNGTGRAPGQQKPPEYYADKTLRYQDHVYDPAVQSVQCYAATNVVGEVFLPPCGARGAEPAHHPGV